MKNLRISSMLLLVVILNITGIYKVNAQSYDFLLHQSNNPSLDASSITTNPATNQLQVQSTFWMNVNTANNQSKQCLSYIQLHVDHEDQYKWDKYLYRVFVEIKGYPDPNDQFNIITEYDTLTIGYDPDSVNAYQDLHKRGYYGYYKMDVEIKAIYDWDCVVNGTCSFSGSPTVPDFLSNTPLSQMAKNWKLEIGMIEHKYDKKLSNGSSWKDAMANAILNVSNTPPSLSDNHLKIEWNIVQGQEPAPALYELEWTYIDDYKYTIGNPNPISQKIGLNYDFTDNATRVITDKSYYDIPLIYNRGYIVYRVRLIRPDESDYRYWLYNDWSLSGNQGSVSSAISSGDAYYISDNDKHLGDDYNWSYEATYAEEGKSKVVVNYYDGLLKQRQIVTKINTLKDQQVAAQTFYNYEGKPGLQTLPIPVHNSGIGFVDDFAYPTGGSDEYTAAEIDPKQLTTLTTLDPGSSASEYYSTSNTFYSNDPAKLKAIPDANGFPLIHTRFDPSDGRVIMQGSAGDEFQLGQGHETKNYFMPASQFELDKYFGYDIGDAAYYEKTITQDPNQQLSFSIANNKGQTILSGLMGYPSVSSALLSPDGITLPSGSTGDFPYVDLLHGQEPIWDGSSKKYNIPHFMQKGGGVDINYTLTIPNYIACESNGNYHYLNIPLDYTIKILNDYGVAQATETGTIGGTSATVGTTTNYGVATGNFTVSDNFSASVSVGKSMIDYEISYDYEDVVAAVDQLFPISYNPEPVYPDCVDKKETFLQEEINSISYECMNEGESDYTTQCDQLRILLLDELYPGAKYGKYEFDNDGNVTGSIGMFAPANYNTNYRYQNFLYEKYILSSVNIPAGFDSDIIMNMAFDMSAVDFIAQFDDKVAELFIEFHPEYCKYTAVNIDCDDNGFINKISDIDNWEVASALGIYDFSSSSPLSSFAATDPIYDGNSPIPPGKLNIDDLTKLTLYYPNNSTNKWQEDRLDHLAFVKVFCTGGVECRNYVYSLSETDIKTAIQAAPDHLKDEFVEELIQLYIINRNNRVEKELKPALFANASCPSTGYYSAGLPYSAKIPPFVIDVMYDASMNGNEDLPAYTIGKLYDELDKTKTFDPDGATTDIKNKLFGNTANEINGFDEYADEIIKRLSNCRDGNNNYNNNGSLKTALLNHMKAAGEQNGSEWKGGITPATIKTILTTNGYSLDDFCNPYLIDYLRTPTNLQKEYDCRSTSFYEGVADFLYTTFNNNGNYSGSDAYVRTALINSALGTGWASAGQMPTPLNSNNEFIKAVVESLYGSFSSSANVYIYALHGHYNANLDNSFTLVFSKTNSTMSADMLTDAVSLTLDMGDISGFSSALHFNSFQTCYTQIAPGGTCHKLFFYNNTQQSNRVTCSKPSYRDDILHINAKINVNNNVNNIVHTMNGTIKGLKYGEGLERNDQNLCLTCVEFKDAIDKQNNSLASFKEDVMEEYNINGVGHPFYEDVLKNYLNYNLEKRHTAQEYLDFMQSCNLAGEYTIPEMYTYMYASSINPTTFDNIINAIKTYGQSGIYNNKYQNFPYYNYYKKDGSGNITEGNLYVDFRAFDKFDMRDIVSTINNANTSFTPTYKSLEKDIRSNSQTFADLFVYYIDGANDGSTTCTTGVSNEDLNWMPKSGIFDKCGQNTNPISITNEVVYVVFDGIEIPYRHFHLEFIGTPTAEEISEYTYKFENEFLPDETRSFFYMHAYRSTGSSENLNDSKKADYLTYTYNQTVPATYDEKLELIRNLQPDKLKNNIDGVSPYTNDFDLFDYVHYYDKWKGIASGDLFVMPTAPGGGIDTVSSIILDGLNNGSQYFNEHTYTNSVGATGFSIVIKRLPYNVLWYKVTNSTNSKVKNIWVKFPDYFPFADFDIESLEVKSGSFEVTSTTSVSGMFKFVVNKALNTNAPLGYTFPDIPVYAKTDFSLEEYNVYKNVLLCSELAAEESDEFFYCYENEINKAIQKTDIYYDKYIENIRQQYIDGFIKHLEENIHNRIKLRAPQSSYMMTMYGYDRAGNLAYTVPPEGVRPIWDNTATPTNSNINTLLDRTNAFRLYNGSATVSGIIPGHVKQTKYKYDASNRLILRSTPDGGETKYFYDQGGRLTASQTAQQRADEMIMYTLYDKQNRVKETGLVSVASGALKDYYNKYIEPHFLIWPWLFEKAVQDETRLDVIHTFYDEEIKDLSLNTGMDRQTFLRKRPAAVARYESINARKKAEEIEPNITIHYSYDISGNIKTLTYDMPILLELEQRYKRIDYDYDLYSGKVTMLSYNRGFADQFYQRYEYDADNRITEVETSKEGFHWDKDANYTYYKHGPLASIGIGNEEVQKLDFVYTLQGWLKSINGDAPDTDKDYGGDDGLGGNPDSKYLPDLVKSTLYYYEDDFEPLDPTDQTNTPGNDMARIPGPASGKSLYNGNIAAAVSIPGYFSPLYTDYEYDQLNRIKNTSYLIPDYTASSSANILQPFSSFSNTSQLSGHNSINVDDIYKATYTYDRDGNLQTLTRNGLKPADKYDYTQGGEVYRMDDLNYYYEQVSSNPLVHNNKLINHTDAATHYSSSTPSASSGVTHDLINYTNNAATRITYDEDGNMVTDDENKFARINWNGYGKVEDAINTQDGITYDFNYDPLNNRFSKSTVTNDGKDRLTEYYVRDAAGNILAIYRQQKKYHLQKVTERLIDNLGTPLGGLTPDVASGVGGVSGFPINLADALLEIDFSSAEAMTLDKDLNFYMDAGDNVIAGMMAESDDMMDDILTNNISLVTTPLYDAYEPDFFSGIFYDTLDSTRRAYIGQLVAPTDTPTMLAIVQELYPDVTSEFVQSTEDFEHIMAYAYDNSTGVSYDHLHNALAAHLTGSKLEYAVDNLLASTTYLEREQEKPGHLIMKDYLKDLVRDKADRTALKTYMNNRADGQDLLDIAVPVESKLLMVYDSDPALFLEDVLNLADGSEIVGQAIEAVSSLSPEAFSTRLSEGSGTASANVPDYEGIGYTQVTDVNTFYLAEHIMYGSSRLGIKNYWPQTFSFRWDAAKTQAVNRADVKASILTARKPWLFKGLNAFVDPNKTIPWGNAYTGKLSDTRVVGLKEYELNNHLGNVMVVTTDKITEEDDGAQNNPVTVTKRASLKSAYDYYPFGMLMPDRHVKDESVQIIYVTRTLHTRKKIQIRDYPTDIADMGYFTPLNPGSGISYEETPTKAILMTSDSYDPLAVDMELVGTSMSVGTEVEFTAQIDNNSGTADPVVIELVQLDGNGDEMILATTQVDYSATITLTGVSLSTANPLIRYTTAMPGASTRMYGNYKIIDVIEEDIVVQERNRDDFDDDYRFGFNGQHKDNELKGIGNSLDFGERIHDSRLGRFLSIDPLAKSFPHYSPYQFAGNTPIQAIDLDGREPLYKGTVNTMTVSGSNNPVVGIASDITIKVQILNISSTNDNDLDYGAMKSYLQGVASKMRGVRTGNVPNAFSFDPKTSKPVNQGFNNTVNVTYSTNVNMQIDVIKSIDQIDNKAVIIGIADGIMGNEPYGVADPFSAVGFVEAGVLTKEKISTIGGKVIAHELGHLFGLSHSNNTGDMMSSTEFDKGRNISDTESSLMLHSAVGQWNNLFNKKTDRNPLDISFKSKRNAKKDFIKAKDRLVK